MVEHETSAELEPIPQPPTKPIVGNLFDVDRGAPLEDIVRLANEYRPIFRLSLGSREAVFVSGFELVDELCDMRRFDKLVGRGLTEVRAFAGDGLFTSHTEEPNWQKAHRILLPAFSQDAMRQYFPMMLDIAMQLVKKWERLNRGEATDVTPDMTRLTLDTIGLCGFNYRFNSFYRERPHPFVEAMTRCLSESMQRAGRLRIQERAAVREARQFDADVASMNELVDRIVKERRAEMERTGSDPRPDLLGRMLTGVDPQSGERLDDVNIRYQIITFLIAGHETTSGLLSFSLYLLLHHPEVLSRAYAEVDSVLGTESDVTPTYGQVHQLRYVSQILHETLRLYPTAPAFSVHPLEATAVIGGRYRLTRERGATIVTAALHRDPSVWGSDAGEFNPDHFSPEAAQQRPANAYKPFGNGQRACIGRQFALLEASLVLGLILQRLELVDHDHYELRIKETLTIKPDDFRIQVKKRAHLRALQGATA
ncbi:MAG: cytochrome P450 [Chloroflexi bacterium]|nr:cytochrome P450 [Chloroflexota bacterium]MBV9601955.1 cytochrome P450 [Chloroflexota bacterium]